MTPFSDAAVEACFSAYPPGARRRMLALRELVFVTAARTEGVGEIREALRWGEPAYLTAQSGSGSTLRIDWKARAPDRYALYFNCRTTLVERFRVLFPDDFEFEGNRALVLRLDQRMPRDSLAFCIEASLLYRAHKRAGSGKARKAT